MSSNYLEQRCFGISFVCVWGASWPWSIW